MTSLALLASNVGDVGSGILGIVISAAFLALFAFAIYWFFTGPAKKADEYVNLLASTIHNPDDAALFRELYRQKGALSVTTAWFLTLFLSPTISYIYQHDWTKAIIALLTFQGLGIWWLVSIFTMPTEVLNKNKKFADEALMQLRLARPQAGSTAMLSAQPSHV